MEFVKIDDYTVEGNYTTHLRDTGKGNEVIYQFNLNHEDPVLREVFQDVRFRRAMSLAINREEMNDIIYSAQASPRQMTVVETSSYFKPEFETAYVEYDPERAEELLDEMGLDERDASGYRLGPDGETLQFEIEYNDIETPKTPSVELVAQYWQEVGIDVRFREISGELQGERAPANLMDATMWHGDQVTDIRWPINPHFNVPWEPGWERTIWNLWSQWLTTDGEIGEEPPEEVKDLRYWWEEMSVEADEERQIELAQKILASQAENLWTIGTIGNAMHPIIVSNRLRNVDHSEGFWAWDTLQTRSQNPSQWFFDE